MAKFFSPDGANAVADRPSGVEAAFAEGWCRDATHPGAGNGTVITATLINQIIANLREVVTEFGGAADGSDQMLWGALVAGLLAKTTYDPNSVGGDAFDMDNMVDGTSLKALTASERELLVALATVDIEFIGQRIEALDQAKINMGSFDASLGEFPGGGVAQAGETWICSVPGTINGVAFVVPDQVMAIADNAAIDTYADNWLKIAYADVAALLNSPAFTGTPTAPTAAVDTNTTQLATTAFVQSALQGRLVPAFPVNVGLAVSANAGALTIALKGADGNDPSASNPVRVPMRHATETNGTTQWVERTAAESIVIPSGAELGLAASEAGRLWVGMFEDGELGVSNRLEGSKAINGVTAIHPFVPWMLESATAIDASADSAGVIYSTSGHTDKPFFPIGFIEWDASGIAVAGTWTTTNLKRIQAYAPGVHLPGDVIREDRAFYTTTYLTTSATFKFTGFGPSITLRSAANVVRSSFKASLYKNNAADCYCFSRVSRGNTDNTNTMTDEGQIGSNSSEYMSGDVTLRNLDKPNVEGAQIYGLQVRTKNAGAQAAINLSTSATPQCSAVLEEIMT